MLKLTNESGQIPYLDEEKQQDQFRPAFPEDMLFKKLVIVYSKEH